MPMETKMSVLEKSVRYVVGGGLIGQIVFITDPPQWRAYLMLAGVYVVTTALTEWDPLRRWMPRRREPLPMATLKAPPARALEAGIRSTRAANETQEKIAYIKMVK